MKNFVLYILIFFLLTSCYKKEVNYSYSGITIKRIDTNGKSSFYYIQNGKEMGEIWTEYSGINDGFKGYLKFDKKGKAEILSGDGYFQTEKIDTLLFDYSRIYSDEINYNLPNICEIWYPIETEQSRNRKTKTKVKIIYH